MNCSFRSACASSSACATAIRWRALKPVPASQATPWLAWAAMNSACSGGLKSPRTPPAWRAHQRRPLGSVPALAGQEVFTSASVGIAFGSAEYRDAAEMFRDADTALYRAKSEGRSRYRVFDRVMRAQAIERLQLETDLRRAIERREFLVFYQPIVSLGDGRVTGVEALLRWRHPDRGPLARRSSSRWQRTRVSSSRWDSGCSRKICRQIREWLDADVASSPLTVAVNVSARRLPQADLPHVLSGSPHATRCRRR